MNDDKRSDKFEGTYNEDPADRPLPELEIYSGPELITLRLAVAAEIEKRVAAGREFEAAAGVKRKRAARTAKNGATPVKRPRKPSAAAPGIVVDAVDAFSAYDK